MYPFVRTSAAHSSHTHASSSFTSGLPHERHLLRSVGGSLAADTSVGKSPGTPSCTHRSQTVLRLELRSFAGLLSRKGAWVHRLPIAQKRGPARLSMSCGAGSRLWRSGPRRTSFL